MGGVTFVVRVADSKISRYHEELCGGFAKRPRGARGFSGFVSSFWKDAAYRVFIGGGVYLVVGEGLPLPVAGAGLVLVGVRRRSQTIVWPDLVSQSPFPPPLKPFFVSSLVCG